MIGLIVVTVIWYIIFLTGCVIGIRNPYYVEGIQDHDSPFEPKVMKQPRVAFVSLIGAWACGMILAIEVSVYKNITYGVLVFITLYAIATFLGIFTKEKK